MQEQSCPVKSTIPRRKYWTDLQMGYSGIQLISNSDYKDFRILATFCPAQNHFLFSLCKFARIIEIPLKEIFG